MGPYLCLQSAASATKATLTDNSVMNAFFCLANRTCYVVTADDAVFGFNIGSVVGATPVSGPFSLMAFTGGCLTSGVAEAETLGDGTVVFFTVSTMIGSRGVTRKQPSSFAPYSTRTPTSLLTTPVLPLYVQQAHRNSSQPLASPEHLIWLVPLAWVDFSLHTLVCT